MHDERSFLRQSLGFISTLAVLLGYTVCLVGCGSDSNIGSVEGVVRLDGKPLTSGIVRFIPEAGRAASGKIQPDGTYYLGTYKEADGALVGKHQVAIIANQVDPNAPKGARMLKANPNVKPLIPKRYMSAATSGLTAEVKPGKNEFPFELSSR